MIVITPVNVILRFLATFLSQLGKYCYQSNRQTLIIVLTIYDSTIIVRYTIKISLITVVTTDTTSFQTLALSAIVTLIVMHNSTYLNRLRIT